MTANRTAQSIQWLTVDTPPAVLIVEISRGRFGTLQSGQQGTLSNDVAIAFSEELRLPRELLPADAETPVYQLFAVIVRDPSEEGFGHFFLYTIAADGEWYMISDSVVRSVPRTEVLKSAATMLWYAKV
jgi:ubiquitin C-terminal hydrolase